MKRYKHNGYSYPPYDKPRKSDIKKLLHGFEIAFKKYLHKIGSDRTLSDFHFDIDRLVTSFVRVDQRRLHYLMYHDGIKINEVKETALICYWLLKYKPISIKHNGVYTVNTEHLAGFCIFIIQSAIDEYRSRLACPKPNVPLSHGIFEDMKYTFMHRNINYDSLVLFVDSLANI